ncbi:MAG: glycosyltransferase 87 family protein [Chloroflexi bacterium]|nr:glycosyltransferase 87 family protein [Chloroflexota bacterium]
MTSLTRRQTPVTGVIRGLRRWPPAKNPWMIIGSLGAASVALYTLGITARYPLGDGLQVPRGSWGTIQPPTPGVLALHVAVYAALTICYVAALRLAVTASHEQVNRRRPVAIVIGVWLFSSVVLLGAYPGGDSHDVFDYLFRGRMLTELNASPLAVSPEAFSRAPFYLYISWRKQVDTYGPLWEYASGAVALIVKVALQASGGWQPSLPSCPDAPASCRTLVAYVTGYRVLAIGLTGLSSLLVYGIVRAIRPGLAHAAVLAWLWSPVLLMATALGAHNDSLMLLAVLAAFYLCQRERWMEGLLSLTLAAHVKLTALLLLPVFGIWLFTRRGLRRTLIIIAAAIGIGIPLSWLLYLPLGGWQTLSRMLYERSIFLGNSFAALAFRLLREHQWSQHDAIQFTTQSATALFAVVAAVLLAQFWYRSRRRSVPARLSTPPGTIAACRAAIAITVVYLLVGSFWFQHWYLVWVLALAALIPNDAFTLQVLPWYGFGALTGNIALDIASRLATPSLSPAALTALVFGVTLLPFLLGVLGSQAMQQKRVSVRRLTVAYGVGQVECEHGK